MCSWCWGFKPVWDAVKQRLRQRVKIVYVLGGLAPETDEPMPQDMREYLQQAWRKVSEVTGVEFNFDFWTQTTPRRSTYPACKAALVAREYDLELAMYEKIQQLYYQQAGNPSDYENLYHLAEELGIKQDDFISRIHSGEIEQQLQQEIMLAETLGVQGLPSVVLDDGKHKHFIQHSYTDVEQNVNMILALCEN